MNMYEKNAEILRVLSHPMRIKLMKELIDRGPCSVNQIASFLSTPQSTTSQNLAKLKSQRIVSSYRKGTEIYYLAPNEKLNYIIEMLLDENLQ
ncbi:helix-turn-helix transcriptional regulator [Bacillus thuringiensis]|nr:helix-turn-helix transcriptional regulator [Bacillus thuringiensis]